MECDTLAWVAQFTRQRPLDSLGHRALARDDERFYRAPITLRWLGHSTERGSSKAGAVHTFGIIGTILGFVHPSGFAVGLASFRQAAGLRALDLIYKRVSVGSDEGDAVVPARSQSGPATGTWRTVRIDDSDSHVSVHRNLTRVGPVVRAAITATRDESVP